AGVAKVRKISATLALEAAAAEPPQRHPLERPPAVGTGEDGVRGPVHHISRAQCSPVSVDRLTRLCTGVQPCAPTCQGSIRFVGGDRFRSILCANFGHLAQINDSESTPSRLRVDSESTPS